MRSFFKLGLSVGLTALVVSAMPACGSDDDGGSSGGSGNATSGGGSGGTGNSSGSGGSGGTSGGGSGGTAGAADQCAPKPSGGDACADAPCTCGTESCPGYKVANIIDLAPCCTGTGNAKCGAYVTQTVGVIIGAPEGCYETAQTGNDDTACPNFQFINPIDQMPAEFAGCCRPEGKCGYAVDISSQSGPDLGCVPVDCTTGGTETSCTPGGSDSGTGGSAGAAGSSGDAGPADASAD